jgi:NhaP-type Na+/H+ or K+/H+ antiporter
MRFYGILLLLFVYYFKNISSDLYIIFIIFPVLQIKCQMVEAKVKAILIFKVINKATMENNIGNAG